MNKLICFSVIFLLIMSCLASHQQNNNFGRSRAEHETERRAIDIKQGNAVITQDHMKRRLDVQQSANKWRRMKIWFDLTQLNKDNKKSAKFYKKVFEIVGQWWEQAVWIKDDKAKAIQTFQELYDQKKLPDYHFPENPDEWREYDLLVHTHMAPTDGLTFAWAGPLYRHPDNQRPITGEAAICWFGDNNFHTSNDAVNRAVGTMIHEFGHVMAFIGMDTFHPHFVNFDKDLNSFLWTGVQVRERAHHFYGCKLEKMKGLALETNGKVPGAHWNESTMDDELMTPEAGDEPEKVSPMMMAFMEDTFWYKSDYRMVENYQHNADKKSACLQKKLCPKIPACKLGTDHFVTSDYRGIGYCEKDDSGCANEVKYTDQNTSQPLNWGKSYQEYGGVFGSKTIIVQGKFIRWHEDGKNFDSALNVPIKAICHKSLKSYTMKFNDFKWNSDTKKQNGNLKVKCTKEGLIKFNCNGDYCSEAKCYDPELLCKERYSKINLAKNTPHCNRSCMKNGRCQPGFTDNTPNISLIKKDIMDKLKNSSPQHRRQLSPNLSEEDNSEENKAVSSDEEKQEHEDGPKSSVDNDSYQCWCYADGKRHKKCPSMGVDGEVKVKK